MSRLVAIRLDDGGLAPPGPEAEQERRVALFDLLESNVFAPEGIEGDAFELDLSVRERRLVFEVTRPGGEAVAEFHLALGPFRRIVKEYFALCESYYDAVRGLAPSQIEAVDEARRALHDEGAVDLREKLAGKAGIDAPTARRLFTLVCALHRTD